MSDKANFSVHFYNPDNAPLNVDVLFQNEHFGLWAFSKRLQPGRRSKLALF